MAGGSRRESLSLTLLVVRCETNARAAALSTNGSHGGINMKRSLSSALLRPGDESIAPVKILDAHGHVVRVVSADEFRRTHPAQPPAGPTATKNRGRRSH